MTWRWLPRPGARRLSDQETARLADLVADRVIHRQRLSAADLQSIVAATRLTEDELDGMAERIAGGGTWTRVAISLVLVGLGAISIVIGAHVVPPVRASLVIPRARGIDHIVVDGAPRGTAMDARGRSTEVTVEPDGGGRSARRFLVLGVPAATAACSALAARLHGGCDRPPTAPIAHHDLDVISREPMGVSLAATQARSVDVQGSGPSTLTITPAARSGVLHLRCHTPAQNISVSLDGRRMAAGNACRDFPQHTLWLRLSFHGGPLAVRLTAPRSIGLNAPGRSATVSAIEATASTGSGDAVIREPVPIPIGMKTSDPRRGFRLVAGVDEPLSTFSTPSATSLSASPTGERVQNALERWSEVWLLAAGAMLGLICTLLTEAYLERRR